MLPERHSELGDVFFAELRLEFAQKLRLELLEVKTHRRLQNFEREAALSEGNRLGLAGNSVSGEGFPSFFDAVLIKSATHAHALEDVLNEGRGIRDVPIEIERKMPPDPVTHEMRTDFLRAGFFSRARLSHLEAAIRRRRRSPQQGNLPWLRRIVLFPLRSPVA